MKDFYVFIPAHASPTLRKMVDAAVNGHSFTPIEAFNPLPDLRNKKLILAVEINRAGFSFPASDFITRLYEAGSRSLHGSSAILLVHSPNEFYTKSIASDYIFLLNQLGCRFPGHPIVEATGSLNNFLTWQKNMAGTLEEICLEICAALGQRFLTDKPAVIEKPRILALHSSSSKTSNTLALWDMVKNNLTGCHIEELHVENGTILDCIGCSFKTCIHFSKQNSCFYGGVMVEEIMPAVERADSVVWICPNYNDAVSANLTAVINRLTALYRRIPFYSKSLFSVVVSGNSGSDTVAKQLIGAMCVNKGFNLPPYFCLTATANDPGSVLRHPGIKSVAEDFAKNILNEIKK